MKAFVSRDKMSRKARRALDLERRIVWSVRPVTRIRESAKIYNRKKTLRCLED